MVDGVCKFEVIDEECVGCNLCVSVCLVENCIIMEVMIFGSVDLCIKKVVEEKYVNWMIYLNNLMVVFEVVE